MRRICNDIIYTYIELVKTPIFNIKDIEYIMVIIFIGCRYKILAIYVLSLKSQKKIVM